MLVDNGHHTAAGLGLRHRKLRAGARRPVLDLGGILNDTATGMTVNLRHGTLLGARHSIHSWRQIGKFQAAERRSRGLDTFLAPHPKELDGTFSCRVD